jgi:hypothetical protein
MWSSYIIIIIIIIIIIRWPWSQASLISGSPEMTENKLISGPFQSYFWDMGKYGKYGK